MNAGFAVLISQGDNFYGSSSNFLPLCSDQQSSVAHDASFIANLNTMAIAGCLGGCLVRYGCRPRRHDKKDTRTVSYAITRVFLKRIGYNVIDD